MASVTQTTPARYVLLDVGHEEVLDMILWMRAFNASGRGRVQFTGFDMQTPTVAMEIVRGFVARYDPTSVTAITRADDGRAQQPSLAPLLSALAHRLEQLDRT